MGYDNDLAERIRELLGAKPDLAEKKMFGGLAFLVHGRMAVAASSRAGSWSASTQPNRTG